MKTYVGTKIIQAEEMSKYKSQDKRYSNLPKKDIIRDGKDEPGYHVVYEDGYESWSPKDIFERAYHEYLFDGRALPTPVYPSGVLSVFSADDPKYGGGHRYQFLNSIGFSKDEAGYVKSRQEISFVKKEEDGTITPGLQSEQLVIALIDRHKKLNAQYPSDFTMKMITGLQMFLEACKERVQDRIGRGVMGDLKK
jgi:hypothetical protein